MVELQSLQNCQEPTAAKAKAVHWRQVAADTQQYAAGCRPLVQPHRYYTMKRLQTIGECMNAKYRNEFSMSVRRHHLLK